jgi:alanine dehydrogenase
MPAVVPHTSTYALTNATFPYLVELVERGVEEAAAADPVLRGGINTMRGSCTNAAVASALGLDWTDPISLVSG